MKNIKEGEEFIINNFIYEIFDGQIKPWERCLTLSAKRKELEEKLAQEDSYFMERMSLEDRQRFQEMKELQNQATFKDEVEIFAQGFTLGVLLMMEVMAKKEAIINA